MTLELASRRVLLVGSSGGHLAQLVPLADLWRPEGRAWVTFATPDARSLLADESVTWAYSPTTRNIWNLLRNTLLAWRVLREVNPEVVVSTGAGVALPFFALARLRRVRTVYVEVFDRIDSTTLTARLCRPFTDLMLLQWPEQLALYPHGHVIGPLL
ncbi:MAG: UDP-N-acetylglucosamine transferase subunit ALG14 [Actinomycetota bacterium]|nr:UDP-N-acetylglucosamine transferase subunit ALG14 [Actinomycetota bacterium]